MLSVIARQDDLEEARRRRRQRHREKIAADTYSAPSMSLSQWRAKCTMATASDDDNSAGAARYDETIDAFSENSIDERMRTLGILTSLLESDKRRRVVHCKRTRRQRIAAATFAELRQSQKLQVIHLNTVMQTTIDKPMPIDDLDCSNTMNDALSSASESIEQQQQQQSSSTTALLPTEENIDDTHTISLKQARMHLLALQGQSITIDNNYTKAMLMNNEYKYTSNTVIIGNGNRVYGHSNLFIGNYNAGNGDYCRARGADNRLTGKCCVNYDSGQRGRVSGHHSVRIKIRLILPASAKEQLSQSNPSTCATLLSSSSSTAPKTHRKLRVKSHDEK